MSKATWPLSVSEPGPTKYEADVQYHRVLLAGGDHLEVLKKEIFNYFYFPSQNFFFR